MATYEAEMKKQHDAHRRNAEAVEGLTAEVAELKVKLAEMCDLLAALKGKAARP